MIKSLFNMFGRQIIVRWWASLHEPGAFARRYAFWCVVFGTMWYCFLFVEIPFKGKTAPQWFIGNEVEQFRLHQNTEEWFVAETERQVLQRECDYISRRVDNLQLIVWQLMAIQGIPAGEKAIEVEKANRELAGAKKKFAVAELALGKITHLLDKLVAQR